MAPPAERRSPPAVALGLGALRHRLLGRRAPLNVMIALTDRCTRRCDYCDIPSRHTPEMDTATLLELLTELRTLGCVRVGFWGGEPLLRDDLGEILAHCRQLGLWTSLDSNGDLLPTRIRDLDHLDHLVLSLDGRAEAHDAQRGKGSHSRVMAALRAAREAELPTWTLTVLTRDNLDEVPWLVELAEEQGHRAAFQVLHHPAALDGGLGRNLHPEPGALRRTLKWLLAAREQRRPICNSRHQLRGLLEWKGLQFTSTRWDPDAGPCLAGQLFLNVDVDGRVSPCSLLVGMEGRPSACELGAAEAIRSMPEPPCNRCTATAFGEYNALFRFHPGVVADWMRDFARG